MRVSCPICKKTVQLGSEDFPFCSDRCRNVDLGNWATEKYVISEPLHPHEQQSESDEE
jgi:endogenous inhibitor of DNA gyrase (YacG/DUF329 family)